MGASVEPHIDLPMSNSLCDVKGRTYVRTVQKHGPVYIPFKLMGPLKFELRIHLGFALHFKIS